MQWCVRSHIQVTLTIYLLLLGRPLLGTESGRLSGSWHCAFCTPSALNVIVRMQRLQFYLARWPP
jgi:hypothetical protein